MPASFDAKRIPLGKAQSAAQRIAEHLLPFATRIEVAGSIRRLLSAGRVFGECGDIDLVIEARDQEALLARVKESGTIITGDSPKAQNTIVRLGDYQLDLFFPRPADFDLFHPIPCTWGTVLLCRTGSMEHNIGFAAECGKRGFHWNPYKGIMKGEQVIACETEEAMYAALDRSYIEPRDRNGNPFA